MLVTETQPLARSLFRSKPEANSKQDRILGALLGAAIGDVMGNSIAGLDKEIISNKYGAFGIVSPNYDSAVSHNFQLMLFALDALMNVTRKEQKLSVEDISKCLLRSAKEWKEVVNHPNLFHGINHIDKKGYVCTDFIKNYPLWRLQRPGKKTDKSLASELIYPMVLALLLCANDRTVKEVLVELSKTLGSPEINFDVTTLASLLESNEVITKANKLNGLANMCSKINQADRPELIGMLSGFEHGAKFGINAFKQIWYLRIDATMLAEQMGWRVGRNFKSY
ncbi:MAG: hypothetical protein RIS18_320 [Actinomycetota bacterium]|jgi:hypothetical protein